jgi:tripartite ATP-independent transporter DctM subunit
MSERDIIAVIGFISLFALMLLRVPVGIAMSLVGVGGFAAVIGIEPALNLLAMSPLRAVTNYELSVIPMFVLMGVFASASGMSRELFRSANAWFGGRRGGLGTATIASCAGFSAICGSSVATAATMTRIALPEMRRLGYADGLATGVIAAGGTLGILIPPSVIMVVYAFITEQDVGKLFIAGVVPGLIAVLMHMMVIWLVGYFRPGSVPPGQKTSWAEKFASLRGTWAIAMVFVAIIGGIYQGIVTPTEAAALGAVVTLIIGLVRGSLTWAGSLKCLVEALKTSVSIYTVIIGALLFGYFLTVTQTPQKVADLLVGLGLGPMGTLALILAFFILLGCVLESMAMMILLVPVVFPVIVHFGFDPIWFGIIMVVAVELGLITPPVGMNLFVIKSVAPDTNLMQIMRGTFPFVVMDVLRLVLLVAFPMLVLYLPSQMG